MNILLQKLDFYRTNKQIEKVGMFFLFPGKSQRTKGYFCYEPFNHGRPFDDNYESKRIKGHDQSYGDSMFIATSKLDRFLSNEDYCRSIANPFTSARFVFLREILCTLRSPDELEREILSEGNLTLKFFLTRRHWRNIVEPCCNLLRLVPTMKNVTVHRVLSPMRGFFSLLKDKRRQEVNPASIPYVKSCAPIGTHEYFIFVVQPRSRR